MAVNNAARNYIGYVASLYDHWQDKNPSPLYPHDKLDLLPDDPLVLKTDDYNQCKKMTEWYAKTDPLSSIKEIYVDGKIDAKKESERVIESKAVEYSAYCRLTEAGEEVEGIIPLSLGKAIINISNVPVETDSEEDDLVANDTDETIDQSEQTDEETYEKAEKLLAKVKAAFSNTFPFFNLISPKSQLDNRVFEKAYCHATQEQRAELIRLTSEARLELKINPRDIELDQLIYKIQGVAAGIFESPLTKVFLLAGFVFVVIISYKAVVGKVLHCFWVVILPRCTALIDLRAPLLVGQVYHTFFNTAVAVNTYINTPAGLLPLAASFAIGPCTSYVSFLIKPMVPILSKVISVCYYTALPDRFILYCARPYIFRAFLIGHKILSGVEHRTIWAIEQKFGKDSEACQQGLKAHAFFLRIMQKGTPKDALMLAGWLPKPSLSV